LKFVELEQKMKVAIDSLHSNDGDLMDFQVLKKLPLPERERPISHRLGFYMEHLFNGYNVDCEYNRHGQETKEDSQKRPIIPDILVHKRKARNSNLLAVEVKARRTPLRNRKGKLPKAVTKDHQKLIDLTRKAGAYGYDYGAFIAVLPTAAEIQWFKNGEPKTREELAQ
jgi:hypothetical protein